MLYLMPYIIQSSAISQLKFIFCKEINQMPHSGSDVLLFP